MKPVKLKPPKPYPPHATLSEVAWVACPPFNVNERGILVHRVKSGRTHLDRGEYSHDGVTYWCGNIASGDAVNLVSDPPKNRLLCSHCERKAVAAGEPPADKLAGRHVHIGVLKALRVCCRESDSN